MTNFFFKTTLQFRTEGVFIKPHNLEQELLFQAATTWTFFLLYYMNNNV